MFPPGIRWAFSNTSEDTAQDKEYGIGFDLKPIVNDG